MSLRLIVVRILSILITLSFFGGCTAKEEAPTHFTVGLVTNNRNGMANIEGFKVAMSEYGYKEGENISYVHEGSPVDGTKLNAVLNGMVTAGVDLIFTAGTPTGIAAKKSTAGSDIPVIFGVIADPVSAKVLDDLAVPGGNMTGIMLSNNQDRRFELLIEIAPSIQKVFVPFNPDDAAPLSALGQIRTIAPKLGVELVEGHARTADQALELIHEIPESVDAVFMLPDSTVNEHISELVAASIERKLPISGPSMMQVEDGALTAYGIIHSRVGAQAARIADMVLKGTDPGTVPVETAEFYLGINLHTAEYIGIDISPAIIQQAEIIVRAEKRE